MATAKANPSPNTDPGHDDRQDLGALLHTAFRGLRHTWTEQLAPWGLTPFQWRALRTLQREGRGMRLKDLAERLRIAPRSATEVIDQLQSLALVTRSPDPDDRRAIIVAPSNAGRDLAEAVLAERRQRSDEYFEPLAPEERRQLAALLARLGDDDDPRPTLPSHGSDLPRHESPQQA